MLKNNPMVKKLVQTGEERVGKLASTLLSNENFVATVQSLVSKSLAAKGSLDKSLRSALAAMNLPSSADVESLRAKVDELDRLLTSVEKKVDALLAARKTP
jgi:polyhydroxyalkanoate synthesis regulator phasin